MRTDIADEGWTIGDRDRLLLRYDRFMALPAIRRFVAGGGRVFLATEGRPASAIAALIGVGHRTFAEKYVQEALRKWLPLRDLADDLVLHDFGRLQTNKVRPALALFDAIESLDRPSLADALARRADRVRVQRLYLQINLGRESQKGGAHLNEADALLHLCQARCPLALVGVMAIPPRLDDPLPHFRTLRAFADRHGLRECVMGMSDDFETAIRCGATAIRIGRAVFGGRVAADTVGEIDDRFR